ncbi:TspO/MBR family protein [Halococcus sp. IIIV-5B]|uniref:TspO/MBR family protein n=1 Tax=Halococcus sp. IIIV-5B TaxID=2321230 RepID=UPI000E70B023|nr:TspO/MBR family protein [Halococcus sp. IIIV-5B]RJT04068.1 tryptophan-rich sensory protein [Halococcus sp. IIIV-5B]
MSITQGSQPALPDRRPLLTVVAAVAVCVVLGAAAGLVTSPQIATWYTTIEKSGFTPPNWVFGPVWTALYALQGVAAWLVWRAGFDRRGVRLGLVAFAVQFVLNLAWSPAFFGLESPALGLVVIVPLWVAIVATIGLFARIDRRAAALLVPYLAWVSFATALNYAIWTLN